ncbi:MAG: hypothetical protein IJT76_03110 [Clostridia bacterium]|nr:hypothetical protein [Clostridia bacterium]
MNKTQKIIWIIDVLTIVFILITLQSGVVCFEEISDSPYFSLKEKILLSIQHYGFYGWSEILHNTFGPIVPWSKFLLFIANVYAVIRKIIGMIKKDISLKSRAFIVVNLLFITLKLIEFDNWWAGLMSV